MKKITDFIVNKRYIILVLFIFICAFSLFLSSKVNINRDISKYLPNTSNVRIGMDIMEKEFDSVKSSSLNVMFKDLDKIEKTKIKDELSKINGVKEVDYNDSNDYNKDNYTLYVLTVDDTSNSATATNVYNKIIDNYKDYEIYTSGDVSDENKTVLPTWIVALAIFSALIILMIMCDSYIEPFLFLTAVGMGVFINKGTNIFFPSISSITSSITAILQLALSMDYSIMLMNRYRQEKENTTDKVIAMKHALNYSFKSISSSSVTTIVGLLALVFMSFTIGMDLGLVLAKGVLFSLLTIFTCLPGLILLFDKLITKTKKNRPKITLNHIGGFAYKFRYVGIIVFLLIFIGSYILKGNLGFLYTDSESDEVGKIFNTNNQMAIVYKNKYEDKISDYCKKLEKDNKIDEVLCYGNTINEKLKYQDLNSKLKDLGYDKDIEDYLLKIVYYNYYDKDTTSKMTFNEFINFIKSDVYTNDKMNDKINNETRVNIDRLSNFTNANLINQKRNYEELSKMFEVDIDKVKDLLTLYNSMNNDNKLTIQEYVTFMNNYVLKSKYSSNIDNNSKNKLNTLSKFIDKNILTKKMLPNELSNLFGIDINSINNLYLYYNSFNDINDKMTINTFVNAVDILLNDDNYKSSFNDEVISKINLLKTFSNTTFINTPISSEKMIKALGVSDDMKGRIIAVYMLNSKNLMSPYEFVEFVLNNEFVSSSLPQDTLTSLQTLFYIMNNSINNTEYTYTELSNSLGLEVDSIKNIYNVYMLNNNEIKITPNEFVKFILNHKDDEVLKSSITNDTISNLTLINNIMDGVINNKSYTSLGLSNLFNIDNETMKLLYSLYDTEYKNKNIELSYKDFVEFLLKDVITNKEYSSNFDNDKINKIKTINNIINSSLNNTKYNKDELYNSVKVLSNDVDKNLIDVLYIYYGSKNNYNNEWSLTIEEFVNYLNNNILKDNRFEEFIDKDMKEDIIDSKDTIRDAKKLIVGDNYSRVVLNTKYALENKETFKFLKNMEKSIGNNDGVYFVGNSPMAYDISKTFNSELNFITILTIAFIFIVVCITFKSILIPTILVLLIQTAVYLTMGILTFTGGSVYFIALLIVQSILMGATIDYAILYTSYYIESRKTMDIKNSVINSYNKSIHTILTSASILTIVTLIVGHFSSAITSRICKTISEGTLCSTILIILILPELIASVDKLIMRKKKRLN